MLRFLSLSKYMTLKRLSRDGRAHFLVTSSSSRQGTDGHSWSDLRQNVGILSYLTDESLKAKLAGCFKQQG